MTPYILSHFKEQGQEAEIELFEKIKYSLQQLPDIDLGNDASGKKIILNCHMFARAVHKVFKIPFYDGWFLGKYDHSWNRTIKGHYVDVYPVGILTGIPSGPLLIDSIIGTQMYRKTILHSQTKKPREQDFSGDEYLHSKVDMIASELSKYTN